MINEILLVHHSHTDIGYTHPQPTVMELHRRFIDRALDFAEQTADWPQESRFKWTCEVTGITLDWWNHADDASRQRFMKCIESGQFEVGGMAWNMTPLMDHSMLLDLLKPIVFFRSLGIPVKSAMNCDVNGLPWGVVDAFLDHGISGFSMAINGHFGHPVLPRPRGFWWEGASGRKLLVYNGLQYGVGAEHVLKVPASLEEARTAIPAYAQRLVDNGLHQTFVMMQVTNPILYDNAGPRLELPEFVRQWNQEGHPIRLRTATLSEVFDRLRKEPAELIPTLRGDWTDWWNFGSGSTALETTLSLEGQRALAEARQLRVWPGAGLPREDQLYKDAAHSLALYAEHTWGADRSIFKPLSSETRIQQALKLVTAHQGVSIARMLRRDGLEHLAKQAGGEEPTALFYNPLPFPVTRTLRIPKMDQDLQPYGSIQPHAFQRQDVILGDMNQPLPPQTWHANVETQWVGLLELPALGYRTWRFADLPTPTGELVANQDGIGNSRIRLTFDHQKGGIKSFKLDGVEYARTEAWNFAQPVLEYPSTRNRRDLFARPNWTQTEFIQDNWRTDWQAVREGAVKVSKSEATLHAGCAEFKQEMEMSNGDRITQHYRVLPGEAGVEIECTIVKVAQAEPHSLYLTLPLAMDKSAKCHFETAGAMVELDREQLPNTSSHYLTTQRLIRLQDNQRGLTVACPDTPLWQSGGFTFGRHKAGAVERSEAMLLAWLCNNYWDTNFQADQSGQLCQRLYLLPHAAEGIEASVKRALPYSEPPQLHWYSARGPVQNTQGQLFDLDLGGVILTGLEHTENGAMLYVLNPSDSSQTIAVRPGALRPKSAWKSSLAGEVLESIGLRDGEIRFDIGARIWTAVKVEC